MFFLVALFWRERRVFR